MTARTAYLLSHSKSTNYWFRRAISQGWRHFAEKREISFSLRTTNKKEVQRRCRLAAGLVQVFFDEVEGRRVHMEEFAQIFGYAPKAQYGKGLAYDFVRMVRALHENALEPLLQVQALVSRLVAFIS